MKRPEVSQTKTATAMATNGSDHMTARATVRRPRRGRRVGATAIVGAIVGGACGVGGVGSSPSISTYMVVLPARPVNTARGMAAKAAGAVLSAIPMEAIGEGQAVHRVAHPSRRPLRGLLRMR